MRILETHVGDLLADFSEAVSPVVLVLDRGAETGDAPDTDDHAWWLAKGGGLIVITYQCEPDLGDAERAQVDGIVNSLRER